MRKLNSVLIVSLLALTGCAESYTVRVNGFAETQNLILPNAHIRVVTDPNSENPLFDNEIKTKIVKLLTSRGFLPVDDPASEYRLTFRSGIMSHLVEDVEFVSGGFGSGGRNRVFINGGYYAPYIRTSWDQWLQIKVFRGDKVVWVGEAVTSKYHAEKRRDIDYLLVGVFEFFGRNTADMKTIEITEKDPRIAALGSYAK
jgi:hypothetical protein